MRKANKDRQLFEKRRNINFDDEPASPSNEKTLIQTYSIDDIIVGMNCSDEQIQLQATQACRKKLSQEKNPPIDDMINKGIIPLCVNFLGPGHRYLRHLKYKCLNHIIFLKLITFDYMKSVKYLIS
jgi:importin subunit alpha-2